MILDVIGALIGSKGAKSASKTQASAARAGIDAQRDMFKRGLAETAPYRHTGARALGALESILMGIPFNQTAAYDYVEKNADFGNPGALNRGAGAYGMLERGSGAGGALAAGMPGNGTAAGTGQNFSAFYASPDYQFRLSEGIKALDRSAAARGMLMGGAQQKAITRFGQNTAASAYDTYMGRLSALAGIGQASGQQAMSGALTTGQGVSEGFNNLGAARASGYAGQANAWTGALNNFQNRAATFAGMGM